MLALEKFWQVIASAALATGAVTAHAKSTCPAQPAEALLDAAPEAQASGFALTQRLCLVTLVRSRTATPFAPEVEVLAVQAPPSPPAAVAPPAPPPRVAARPLTTRDAAGQARVRALAPLMAEVASRHDIDPLLLHAVAHIESRHQSQAISHAGARGLMQVMPATGRDLGVADARDLLTPQANVEASAKYLKRLQARFGNDLTLVLAAYNAGEGAVERHGRRVPPYAETQAYVRNVMAVYAELRRSLGGQA